MKLLRNRHFYKVCGIFILGIIIYGIIISFFTATVYVNVDEELYVALAKSFHYAGRFEVNGQMANYNCVLYSMLLSLAYFFYSPEHILFIMRLIGVLSMCSAVFPIWLLARRILAEEKEVLLVSTLSMFMPYMFDCAYLIQEVLSYPLFLWTVYFLYRAYERINDRECYRQLAAGAAFSVFGFFTKTYLFFIPVVFNVSLFWNLWKRREIKKALRGLAVYDGIYLLLTGIFYGFIYGINGFGGGNNHYAGQFSWLFPITGRTVISGISCLIIYFALLIINMGVVPILSLWFQRRKYEKEAGWFAIFVLESCAFLLVEIVVLIVLTEEGAPIIPHKFLFRYFQVLAPPVLILFMKVRKEMDFLRGRAFQGISFASLIIAIIYFIYANGNTRQSIADGYFYLLLENVTKNILPYGDVIAIFLLGCLLGFIIRYSDKRRESCINFFINIGCAGIIILWLLNCIQLPLYTNSIAGGKVTQEDSIAIAGYLNQNDYEFIYYVASSTEEADSYIRNFYGYMRQPHQVISGSDIGQILEEGSRGKVAFLVSTEVTEKEIKDFHMKKVDLPLNKLMVYVVA